MRSTHFEFALKSIMVSSMNVERSSPNFTFVNTAVCRQEEVFYFHRIYSLFIPHLYVQLIVYSAVVIILLLYLLLMRWLTIMDSLDYYTYFHWLTISTESFKGWRKNAWSLMKKNNV